MLAALRAPDHAELMPFRFCVVSGATRQDLAQLFVAYAQERGKDPASIAIEEERALRAPVTIAVLARLDLGHPLVPVHEQWMCVGGAVTNVLNAAHGMGFAGKMLSGEKARSAKIAAAFCEPGETLVGWIAIGTPTRAIGTRQAKSIQQVLQWWVPK